MRLFFLNIFFFSLSLSPSDGYYIEADLRGGNFGDTAQLISPVMTSSATSCLHFRFKISPAHAAVLSVCTLSVVNGKQFLDCSRWTRSSSVGEGWSSGHASLPLAAYPYAVVFHLRRGVRGGVASLDDVRKTDDDCS